MQSTADRHDVNTARDLNGLARIANRVGYALQANLRPSSGAR